MPARPLRLVKPRPRRAPAGLVAAASLALWASISGVAEAAPGEGLRLGGIEPQGPASRAVTALHHNPAMLAAIPGTAIHASLGLGIRDERAHARRSQLGEELRG